MGLVVVHESSAGFVNPGLDATDRAPTRRAEHLPGAPPDDQVPIERPRPRTALDRPASTSRQRASLDRLLDRRSRHPKEPPHVFQARLAASTYIDGRFQAPSSAHLIGVSPSAEDGAGAGP